MNGIYLIMNQDEIVVIQNGTNNSYAVEFKEGEVLLYSTFVGRHQDAEVPTEVYQNHEPTVSFKAI